MDKRNKKLKQNRRKRFIQQDTRHWTPSPPPPPYWLYFDYSYGNVFFMPNRPKPFIYTVKSSIFFFFFKLYVDIYLFFERKCQLKNLMNSNLNVQCKHTSCSLKQIKKKKKESCLRKQRQMSLLHFVFLKRIHISANTYPHTRSIHTQRETITQLARILS